MNPNDYDQVQVELMKEEIIIVDEDDNVLRSGSKKECHLNSNIDKGLLHRAFSVFLFNSKNELLMQQRSSEKITFPLYWANTCCSHPLYTEEELEEENSLGVKRAAIRKLNHELGIPLDKLKVEDFNHLATMHYVAKEEGIWGEHEVDHVLLVKFDETKLDLEINCEPNEVKEIKYFNQEELIEFINDENNLISPWFNKIQKTFLKTWFDNIKQDDLKEQEIKYLSRQPKLIHRL